eukprot:6202182-Pleurochrysis_carterae.AAC.2
MEEHHRVKVAKYLDSIGCALDIRAKGQRNPEQKWFAASTFDQFCCGKFASESSQSPGLATNIWAILGRIIDVPVPAAAQPPAPAPAPAQQRAAPAPSRSRRNRAASEAGFGEVANPELEDFASGEHLDLKRLGAEDVGASLTSSEAEVGQFVRGRFGNHSEEVLDIMRLWETYAELHAALMLPGATLGPTTRHQHK